VTDLSPIGEPFRTDEPVRITCEGRTVYGTVLLASQNGRALMLQFEALLAGHAGTMPVWQEDDGTFVSLVGRVPIGIERVRH